MFAAIGLSNTQLEFPAVASAQDAVKRIFPILGRRPAIDAASPEGITPEVRAVISTDLYGNRIHRMSMQCCSSCRMGTWYRGSSALCLPCIAAGADLLQLASLSRHEHELFHCTDCGVSSRQLMAQVHMPSRTH